MGFQLVVGQAGCRARHVAGCDGTALAQQHLRNVLAYLDVKTLGQPEMFIKHDPARIDDQGQIVSEDTRKFLQGFVDRYTDWVRLLKSA